LNEKKSSSQIAHFHIRCIQNEIKKLQGQNKEFEDETLKLKEEMKNYFGSDDHYMAPHFMFWLAHIEFKKGNLEKASTHLQNAFAKLKTLKKTSHRNFGECLILSGDIDMKKSQCQKAYKHYLEAEAFFDNLFKTKKVRFFSDLYQKIALLGIKMKDMQIVQKYFHRLKDTFGLKDPATLNVLNELDKKDLKVPWTKL
jgi:tetratricopeptide (TPR) repeat protein